MLSFGLIDQISQVGNNFDFKVAVMHEMLAKYMHVAIGLCNTILMFNIIP